MWTSQDGYFETIRTYIYHQNQPGTHGDRRYAAGFRFEKERWYRIGLHIKLNTTPSTTDGFAVLSIDGNIVANHTNIRFHNSTSNDAKIYKVLFETFHGGGNSSWSPVDGNGNYTTVYSRLDNLQIWSGNGTSVGNQRPTANAGISQTVVDTDHDNHASVQLDGSLSSAISPRTITDYRWTWDGGSTTGVSPMISLPIGTHSIELQVTDSEGKTQSDNTSITITPSIDGLRLEVPEMVTATDAQDDRDGFYASDGDLETRWSSDARPTTLTIEFASPISLSRSRIAWFKGDERQQNFKIEAQTDSSTSWVPLYDGFSSGETEEFEIIPLLQMNNVSRVRLVGNGNSVNNWTSPYEVEWYASEDTASAYDQNYKDRLFASHPKGTSGEHTDFDAKANGKHSNGLLYALGVDSLAASAIEGKLPITRVIESSGDRYIELKLRRRKGGSGSMVESSGYTVDGIRYMVERSSTLGEEDWHSGTELLEIVGAPVDNEDGTELVTVRIKQALGESQKDFIRFRVQPN